MEIEKVIRILAVFMTVAAFALCVATQLLFPDTSLTMKLPMLVALSLCICNIWQDTNKEQKQNSNK